MQHNYVIMQDHYANILIIHMQLIYMYMKNDSVDMQLILMSISVSMIST